MQGDAKFIKIVEAVEEDGGELLAETHYPRIIKYKDGSDPAETTGCNQEYLLRVPYEHVTTAPDGAESGDPVLHDIKVCALDDRVDLWPRFAKRV